MGESARWPAPGDNGVWPKQAHVNMGGRGLGGVQPHLPPSPSLYWPCSRLTIPTGGQGLSPFLQVHWVPGVQRVSPLSRLQSPDQTHPRCRGGPPGPLGALHRAGRAGPTQPATAPSSGSDRSVSGAPTLTAQRPGPSTTSPASPARGIRRGSLLGNRVSNIGLKAGAPPTQGPGPSPLRIVGV